MAMVRVVVFLNLVLLLCSASKSSFLNQVELRSVCCKLPCCVCWLQLVLLTCEWKNRRVTELPTSERSFIINIFIVSTGRIDAHLLLRHLQPVIVISASALIRDILFTLVLNTR